MRQLIAIVLVFSVSANASRLDGYFKAASDNIVDLLFLNNGDFAFTVVAQDLSLAEKGMNFGVETKIEIKSLQTGSVMKRLCNTQFVQTSRGFEVFKTNCI